MITKAVAGHVRAIAKQSQGGRKPLERSYPPQREGYSLFSVTFQHSVLLLLVQTDTCLTFLLLIYLSFFIRT
jgi:hypothetical protein